MGKKNNEVNETVEKEAKTFAYVKSDSQNYKKLDVSVL